MKKKCFKCTRIFYKLSRDPISSWHQPRSLVSRVVIRVFVCSEIVLCSVHLARPTRLPVPDYHRPPTSIWGCITAVTASREPRPEGRKEVSEERRLHWQRGHYIGVTKWRSRRKHHSLSSSLPWTPLTPLSPFPSTRLLPSRHHSIRPAGRRPFIQPFTYEGRTVANRLGTS